MRREAGTGLKGGDVQYRGELKTPGDRDPGIAVCLDVDEFHLEILSGESLLGRWYLADVEVERLGGEHFILYLGDEQAEFVAEDALQFAYEGVTAMQEAWLRLKKGGRRQRRAAELVALRKDRGTAPDSVDEAVRTVEPPQAPAPKVAPARTKLTEAAKEPARAKAKATPAPAPQPIEANAAPARTKPAKEARARTKPVKQAPVPVEPPITRAPKPSPDLPAEPPEPISRRLRRLAVEAPVLEPTANGHRDEKSSSQPVRYAVDGHHPAETTKGLRSRLRKDPKLPEDHVHRFEDGGAAVGIRRRVCVECAYVSIGTSD
jgi:hypothetical protein